MNQTELTGILTISELADLIKVPKATLYSWRTLGRGPKAIKLGKHLRYRVTDVNEWIAAANDEQATRAS